MVTHVVLGVTAKCGVCTAEGFAAREQLDAGESIAEVRRSIIDRFGPPPQPEPGEITHE